MIFKDLIFNQGDIMKKIFCYFLLSIAISGCASSAQSIGNGQFKTTGWDNDAADKNAIEYCKGMGKLRVVEKLIPAVNPWCAVGKGLCEVAYLTFSCK